MGDSVTVGVAVGRVDIGVDVGVVVFTDVGVTVGTILLTVSLPQPDRKRININIR